MTSSDDDNTNNNSTGTATTTGKDLYFDYVIVGTGPSAMGLLYGLLEPYSHKKKKYGHDNDTNHDHDDKESTDDKNNDDSVPTFSVAIIERGKGFDKYDPSTIDPMNWFEAAHSKESINNNIIDNDKEKAGGTKAPRQNKIISEITGRKLDIPVGRGIGGTSNINACICTSPSLKNDLTQWPSPWNTSLHKYIHHVQESIIENDKLYPRHSTSLNISEYQKFPFREKATNELQWKSPSLLLSRVEEEEQHHDDDDDDDDNDDQENKKPAAKKEKKKKKTTFRRCNYYDGLLKPLLQQNKHLEQCLHWFFETEVQKLLIEVNNDNDNDIPKKNLINCGTLPKVEGVLCRQEQRPSTSLSSYQRIYATKQVILCAGAIETPTLLLLSGVGDRGDKTSKGLSGIGRHLQDQLVIPRMYFTPPWQKVRTQKSTSTNNDSSKDSKNGNIDSNEDGTKQQGRLHHHDVRSINGIAAIANMNLTITDDDGHDDKNKDGFSHKRRRKSHHMYQLAITDPKCFSYILPRALAMSFRRASTTAATTSNTTADKGFFLTTTLEKGKEWIFETMIFIFRFFIDYTPIGFFLYHFTTIVLLFYMNPYSEGSISIISTTANINNDDGNENDMNMSQQQGQPEIPTESTSTSSSSSSLIKQTSQRYKKTSIYVDVGYLNDQRDLQAVQYAWDDMSKHANCTDVFPGLVISPAQFLQQQLIHILSLVFRRSHPIIVSLSNLNFFHLYFRAVCLPYYHFASTCRMKQRVTNHDSNDDNDKDVNHENRDDDWVVNEHFQVRNYHSLLICDASIFPTMVSVPPSLTCAGLGYGLSQNITSYE